MPRTRRGQTILHRLAATPGNVSKMIDALHDFADQMIPDADGDLPIHIAVREGLPWAVRTLIEYGDCDAKIINAKNAQQETPLHLAAFHAHVQIVRILLYRSANLEARDNYGYTPLHSAMIGNEPVIVRALLEAGADQYPISNIGMPPYMLAKSVQSQAALDVLDDWTAEQMAAWERKRGYQTGATA